MHACIDNAIHCAAGPRLRDDCATIMALQGHEEPTGHAKVLRVRRESAWEADPDEIFATLDELVAVGARGDHVGSRAALFSTLARLDPVPARATA